MLAGGLPDARNDRRAVAVLPIFAAMRTAQRFGPPIVVVSDIGFGAHFIRIDPAPRHDQAPCGNHAWLAKSLACDPAARIIL